MKRTPLSFHTLKPFMELFQSGVPVLMYHKIGVAPPRARLKGLYVRPERFAEQLAELRTAGFASCRMTDVNNKDGEARRVALTFDDGFQNVSGHALEPLRQHGFTAIQFLVANYIGRENHWEIREGETLERLMDPTQVREWIAAGHRIGSHSLSHPHLTRLSIRDAREEILTSKKKLEDTFGVPIEDFCYPYGSWNKTVRNLVMEAGYRTACSTDFGVNTPTVSAFSLRRIIVRHPSRSLKTLKTWLLGV